MLKASFLNIEDDGKDLILAFALADERGVAGIRTLMLLRTPRFEILQPQEERGVSVSMEDDEEEGVLLTQFDFIAEGPSVTIRTDTQSYEIDLSAVDAEEIQKLRGVIKKMNFDGRFKLSGV